MLAYVDYYSIFSELIEKLLACLNFLELLIPNTFFKVNWYAQMVRPLVAMAWKEVFLTSLSVYVLEMCIETFQCLLESITGKC